MSDISGAVIFCDGCGEEIQAGDKHIRCMVCGDYLCQRCSEDSVDSECLECKDRELEYLRWVIGGRRCPK